MARKRPTHPTGSSGVQAIMAAAARDSRLLIKHVRKVLTETDLNLYARVVRTDNGDDNNALACVWTIPRGGEREETAAVARGRIVCTCPGDFRESYRAGS